MGLKQASLSGVAERALLDAIQTRKHGDTFYFWVRMDQDPRNPLQQDFWSFCDSINAGNCKLVLKHHLAFIVVSVIVSLSIADFLNWVDY